MTLFEHERIRVGQTIDGHTLSSSTFDTIAAWQERCKERYVEIGHRSIRATQWVGVIQVGTDVIEILPKADANRDTDTGRDKSIQYWKFALLQMVAALRGFRFRHSERASLQLQKHSLLEVFHWMFVEEAEALLREGLVKAYRKVQRNRPAWRGRLVVSEDIKRNLVHRERVYTDAMEYDIHNSWNRILVAGLFKVVQRTSSHLLKAKTRGLLLPYLDWNNRSVGAGEFDRLHYDRRTDRYREAMELARLLLLDQNPDLQRGSSEVFSLLFDMNKLWEAWVAHEVRKKIKGTTWTLKTQSVKAFWEGGKTGSETSTKTIKPDLLLIPGPESEELRLWQDDFPALKGRTVLDTKWKTSDSYIPGDADLKQMYVYNKLYGIHQALLLYPKPRGCRDVQVAGQGAFQDQERSRCAVAFLDLPG
ncbi:MAG TPA: hypothetical protein PKO15_18530 [Fibrobacteria bacterium]|nr:hypothetical protein [Fibrobacteria bacterium]